MMHDFLLEVSDLNFVRAECNQTAPAQDVGISRFGVVLTASEISMSPTQLMHSSSSAISDPLPTACHFCIP